MSEDPTEDMDVVNFDPESQEWVAVPPGQPITDQGWLTSIKERGPGLPAKRDLVLLYSFDVLVERLRDIDKMKMWGIRRTLRWMVKMLKLQGIELVGLQRQNTPNGMSQMQDES